MAVMIAGWLSFRVRMAKLWIKPFESQLGKGDSPRPGDRVCIDWEGYTIGYYGRPFEAKGKIKVSNLKGGRWF